MSCGPPAVLEAADVSAVTQLILRERFGRDLEVMLSSHTRLLLRAERRAGVWRLFGFDPVYLRDEIAPVIPGQTVAIDPAALKDFRPSYRFLSYCFASVGYPVPNDLAGVDRPDLVDALVREIYGWAGLTPPR